MPSEEMVSWNFLLTPITTPSTCIPPSLTSSLDLFWFSPFYVKSENCENFNGASSLKVYIRHQVLSS